MLQRQRWRQYDQIRSSLFSTHKRPPIYNQLRHYLNYGPLAASFSTSARSSRSTYAVGRVNILPASRRNYSSPPRPLQVLRPSKPLSLHARLNNDTLTSSLGTHQGANENSITRSGTDVKRTRHKTRYTQDQRGYGLWPGLKVLHLDTTEFSQSSHTESNGTCPELMSECSPRQGLPKRLQYPWISRLTRQENSGLSQPAHIRLGEELRACQDYFKPTEIEKSAATNAWSEIKAILQAGLDPAARFDLIGSRASGIEGPTSDIDINVQLPVEAEADTAIVVDPTRRMLNRLNRHVSKARFRDQFAGIVFLRKANIPILIGTHISSGLEFQVQSTTFGYDSLEVSRAFVAEYPSACILFKILKQMLLMRGLTGSGSNGRVTSYPLLNMIVASLKLADARIEADDLVAQLFRVLDFWSAFDFSKHKVVLNYTKLTDDPLQQVNYAIDPISASLRVVPKESGAGDYMSLQDPADPSNDLGRKAHNIRNVQACFAEAARRLRQSMQEWDTFNHISGNREEEEPILAWCLGGDYTTFEEARWQLYKYGMRSRNQDI